MASFFQSFRSSSMAKQLLRFALSRLDLLDAQALDLENLDFAIGRNTVLEFRDVGLVLQVRTLQHHSPTPRTCCAVATGD